MNLKNLTNTHNQLKYTVSCILSIPVENVKIESDEKTYWTYADNRLHSGQIITFREHNYN